MITDDPPTTLYDLFCVVFEFLLVTTLVTICQVVLMLLIFVKMRCFLQPKIHIFWNSS